MKKRLLTLVSCLLVVAMCVALLAACVVIEDDTVGAEFENFVYNYGNITTKNSTYTVPNKIDTLDSKGGDAVIYVKWEKGGNDANLVTLTEGEDETTVSLPNLSGQISYTLTATFVNAKGKEYLDSNKNPYSHTFTCNVTLGTTGGGGGTGGNSGSYTPVDGNGTQSSPYTVAQAVAIAGAQEKNAYLDYCYVKGVVTKITYTGDATKSWSFEMSDGSGTTVLKGFYVYLGNGITTLEVGDIVTVYGQLVNFDDGKNAALEITAQKGATQSATIVSKG
ncbi:MAG: hypothetical protein J1F65_03920 [Clostridiales bacterium]|nr:hypothetical protein [Clostridiales bacterium]